MSNTIVVYKDGYYALPLKTKDIDITTKFDTGSTTSFFTLSGLDMYNNDLMSKLLNAISINDSRIEILRHTSASNHEMKTIKCYMRNVTVGNIYLEKFYFALRPTLDYNKALIGTDFIRCCKFTHDINNDIIIKSFDNKLYNNINKVNRPKATLCIDDTDLLIGCNLYSLSILIQDNWYTYTIEGNTPFDAINSFISDTYGVHEIYESTATIYNVKTELLNGTRKSVKYYYIKW